MESKGKKFDNGCAWQIEQMRCLPQCCININGMKEQGDIRQWFIREERTIIIIDSLMNIVSEVDYLKVVLMDVGLVILNIVE